MFYLFFFFNFSTIVIFASVIIDTSGRVSMKLSYEFVSETATKSEYVQLTYIIVKRNQNSCQRKK